MSIQQLIAAGKQRKEENEDLIQEEARRKEEEHRKVNEESWSMILEEVAQLMPEELRHVLAAPNYPALSSDSGRYRSQPFTIDLPENAGKIWCNTDIRWNGRNSITFQAMTPYMDFNESSNTHEVYWHRAHGEEQTDFLVALAEAASFADTLPYAQAEADRKNGKLREEIAPVASDDEPMDYIENAIASLGLVDSLSDEAQPIWIQTAQAHAMIAIAQELRRLNDREQMSNHTGPWLVEKDISTLLDKVTK